MKFTMTIIYFEIANIRLICHHKINNAKKWFICQGKKIFATVDNGLYAVGNEVNSP